MLGSAVGCGSLTRDDDDADPNAADPRLACPSLSPSAARVVGTLTFEQLEFDDPDRVCCHPYGFDVERRRLLGGGRRHCSEPPSEGTELPDTRQAAYSLGCFFAYYRGCPSFVDFLPNPYCYRLDGQPLTTGFDVEGVALPGAFE
jgi:hypothetical protein